MTALRLAGESQGVADFFPDEFKTYAAEISKITRDSSVLSDYAGILRDSGYPPRMVSEYVDKEADWIRQDKKLLTSYRRGRDHYIVSCGACHQADGKGLTNMAPTLANSDWVTEDADRLIGVAVHGLMGPIHINGEPVSAVPQVCLLYTSPSPRD